MEITNTMNQYNAHYDLVEAQKWRYEYRIWDYSGFTHRWFVTTYIRELLLK